jgi:hypothetical protein
MLGRLLVSEMIQEMHGDMQTYKTVTAQQARLIHIVVNTKEDLSRPQ